MTVPRLSGRALKTTAILAGLIIGGVELIAATQTWVQLQLTSGLSLAVSGETAAPALAAIGLAGLALAAALSLAGPVFRVILGILQLLVSATVLLMTALAIIDPLAASASAVTDATGVGGNDSVTALVATVQLTAWPWIVLVLGVLGALLGLGILITTRHWPRTGRKYQAVRFEQAAGESSVDDWDALSDGQDPTAR
ncbi:MULTISPECIES: Trp biosynthesis-associated membrane protein [unclassified Salinibacterium]|uniref:Trp biosynthesis-associated membrane protein n=1 Tax=unclassified Salinibacterium TaxID=2632331 RepID=UPI001423A8B2|nr:MULTISPECIES: Trp biosynthesis-associated membrane protein [unclassified Salinibacterium]